MYFLLALIALSVLAPMVLGPFLIKSRQWVAASVDIRTVTAEALDLDVRAFLDKARIDFESIGFDFAGYMLLSDYMPDVTTYFALFTDKKSRTPAMAAVIRHASGRTIQYYEFTNKYSNGRVINVNNSPMLGTYVHPDKSSYRYPNVTSIKQLYDINKWVTSHDKKAINPEALVQDREMEMLSEALNNETRRQEKLGYFHLNEDRTRFMLTWKGAFLMTEKNAFPIKNILNFLDLQSAEKALAGMPPSPAGLPAARNISPTKTDDNAHHQAGKTAMGPGAVSAAATRLKLEQQFKNGASWFFWIAALSLINSLAMKAGSSWNFLIGLAATQLVDFIALSVQSITSPLFQAIVLFLDAGFAALFVVFGLMARKKSVDGFVMGMFFYGLDALLFLLVFDVIGIAFHVLALFFIYRGWVALKKLDENPASQAQQPA